MRIRGFLADTFEILMIRTLWIVRIRHCARWKLQVFMRNFFSGMSSCSSAIKFRWKKRVSEISILWTPQDRQEIEVIFPQVTVKFWHFRSLPQKRPENSTFSFAVSHVTAERLLRGRKSLLDSLWARDIFLSSACVSFCQLNKNIQYLPWLRPKKSLYKSSLRCSVLRTQSARQT